MIYRARTLYHPEGEVVEDGAVQVEGSRIAWAGPWKERPAEGPTTDLGEVILMPGLINAHCHLDYTLFRNAIDPQKSFADWIRRINAVKGTAGDDDYLRSIEAGFQELVMWGTTTVLNIEAFPELLPRLPPPSIRTWWFWEILDIRNRVETEALTAGIFRVFERDPEWLGGMGLSPHSPYTASTQLYRLAAECARAQSLPTTTHLAESQDEFLMFLKSSGPLYEFLRSIGRNMSDCGSRTPLAHLLQNKALPDHCIVAHLNELSESDYELIRTVPEARSMNVVHCPLSHKYFGHHEFPYQRLAAMDLNICLGTDSLASTHSLNLFEEMREFQKRFPATDSTEVIRMATIHGARAIGEAGRLGTLTKGAHADLISLPFVGKESDAADFILHNRVPIEWMIVAGTPRNTARGRHFTASPAVGHSPHSA